MQPLSFYLQVGSGLPEIEQAVIVHVDMDAFYASVEQLDDPSLEGQAIVVGGLGPRGVVATANYEARRFGVHSAMPMGRARRLCPQARFIRPRMERYCELSEQVFGVFAEFTPLVEGLSLDEAFLDVSGSLRLFGGPRQIAERIKQGVHEKTGLTASVGVSHNKFLAKLASDARKPDGLLWLRPEEVGQFLDPLPVSRLWGIGKQTAPKLKALGILTVGQLRRTDLTALQPVLGRRAEHFQRLARGEDERAVEPVRADLSISHEVTFDDDIGDPSELLAELQRQTENVARRLRARGLMARTVVVKIRDANFHTVTRSRSLRACSSSTRTLYRMARALLENWRSEHRTTPLRLLGVGLTGLESGSRGEQAVSDRLDSRGEQDIDRVSDQIKRRFGEAGLVHAQTLRRKKPIA